MHQEALALSSDSEDRDAEFVLHCAALTQFIEVLVGLLVSYSLYDLLHSLHYYN